MAMRLSRLLVFNVARRPWSTSNCSSVAPRMTFGAHIHPVIHPGYFSTFSSSSGSGVHPLLAVAQDHLENQRGPEAIDALRQVIKDQPDNVPALISLALIMQHIDEDEAENLFAQCVAAKNLRNDVKAMVLGAYASFLHDGRDVKKAEQLYRDAIKMEECREPIVFQYARLLHETGRAKEAREMYERALEMDGGKTRTWCALGNLLVEKFPHLKDTAEKCYENAMKIDSEDFETSAKYAHFLSKMKKDNRAALEHYTRALAIDPIAGTPLIAKYLQEWLGRKKAHGAFDECVRRAVPETPILPFFRYAIHYLDEMNDTNVADKYFKKCLEIPPEKSNIGKTEYAHVVLKYASFCINSMNRIQEAKDMMQYALRLAPNLPQAAVQPIRELLDDDSEKKP